MGRQIAIAGTADDIAELVAHASHLGARAVPSQVPVDGPPALHDPVALHRRWPDEQMYLLPAAMAAVEILATAAINRPGAAFVNDRSSPVVQLVPPHIDAGRIRSGRLYLGVDRSDPRYSFAARLYAALMQFTDAWRRQVRNPGSRWSPIRIAPQAAELARSGRIVVTSSSGDPVVLENDASENHIADNPKTSPRSSPV